MKTKILVIEDEISIQVLLQHVLESNGYEVLIANDSKEGLQFLEHNTFDIVCTDIMLPYINGLDLCKIIREKYPEILVIVVSSQSQKNEKDKVMESGAHGYITKPFDVESLLKLLRTVLQEKI